MNTVLLNFSGHTLTADARKEFESRFARIEEIPFQEIDFRKDVEVQLKVVISKVRTPLDGSVPISIIPPGQSTISILLVIFLYGLLGYFPEICFLEAKNPGNYKPTNTFYINGHQLRKTGRIFRQEQWNRDQD